MNQSKIHGFRRGNEVIHITHLTTHKKPALLIGNEYCCQKIALFDNDEAAEDFCKMLSKWLGIDEQKENDDGSNN